MVLVASLRLTDPNFARSVVYLLDHGDHGSLGFIVNRPLDLPLRELWNEVPTCLADAPLAAEGGPVEPDKGLLLHHCLDLVGAQHLAEGVVVGGDPAALAKRYARGGDATGPRLFLGHSGWAPGQLLAELEEGAWILRPGRLDLLLEPRPPTTLWQQLSEGGHVGLPDPSMN